MTNKGQRSNYINRLTKTGKVNTFDPKNGKITYKISTLPGQSGSPVLCYGNIKAIHVGGGRSTDQFNVGRMITFQVAERLGKWCQELKSHQFQINNQTKCTHYRATNESLELASELMINGERLYQRKQYSLALEKFTKSLEIFQRIKGIGSFQTASPLAFIGTVQNVLGNYQQAILYMTQAYQIHKNENRPKDLQYFKLLNNIGNTFYFTKNYSMSKEFYKDCADCCEKTAVKDTIYPYSLSGLGGSYYFLNDFKAAASSFEKALPVYKAINAPSSQCALWLCKCYKILNENAKLAKLISDEKVDSSMI